MPTENPADPIVRDPSLREAMIENFCDGLGDEAAKRVRAIAKARPGGDTEFWMRVALREDWFEKWGSYYKWDESARSQGIEPTEYGMPEGEGQ